MGFSVVKGEYENVLEDCINLDETLFINKNLKSYKSISDSLPIGVSDIDDAEQRLLRFAPLIKKLFPETKGSDGIIESDLKEIYHMKNELKEKYSADIDGILLMKMDSELPIAGSVKARGGIYEVLKHAECLAYENHMIDTKEDYTQFASDRFREFFNNYTVQVGSTGNLGISIGVISSKLGFKTNVHMSKDAKEWKKKLLRENGVNVIEYEDDYSSAVKEGRRLSDLDKHSYFVDDENSYDLLLGYSVAARRISLQLEQMGISVNKDFPLFVYIPCGVGGAPAGITFGLKSIYGDNVHCFFVEPTHAPCMLLGMATEKYSDISVNDVGIDGITQADGLAVGRCSKIAGKLMANMLSGIFTVEDYKLYDYMRLLNKTEDINIEPSSCAAFQGIVEMLNNDSGIDYMHQNKLDEKVENITHIVWATGGKLVPSDIMQEYLNTYL